MRRDSWRSVAMMRRPPSAFDLLVVLLSIRRAVARCALALAAASSVSSASTASISFLDVAAQHDVGAAAGHVGGDGDHLRPAGLRHDVGFARMLLGVEHLVRQLLLVQQLVDDFGVLDRGGADQHRLAALVAVADVLDGRFVLFARGLVDAVQLVLALARAVGRNHDGFQAVDFLELVGLGIGRAGHAGQLAVQAEIVLEGDRGQRLVLGLDLHAFLGFHGLVQAFAPAPARHQAAGELVDDHDFAVLHHVVLVAVVQVVGAQRRVQVVHQRDVGRVVQRRAFGDQAQLEQDALGVLVALLGQEHLVGLLVDREVAGLGDALAGARVGFAFLLVSSGTTLFMRTYISVWSSAWPLMISGVRASSIRIESTSSTMA